MSIISLLVILVVLGLVFWGVEQIPMAAPFPAIVRVVAVIVAVLLLLQAFGLYSGLNITL
jgi:hypothetical protein